MTIGFFIFFTELSELEQKIEEELEKLRAKQLKRGPQQAKKMITASDSNGDSEDP